MTGNGDGLLPGAHRGADGIDQNGGAEDRSVKDRTDGAVGALPHLGEVILLHALAVGGDGGTLDGDAVLLGGVCRVKGHLIAGPLSFGKPEVVIFGLQVDEGKEKLLLDHLP